MVRLTTVERHEIRQQQRAPKLPPNRTKKAAAPKPPLNRTKPTTDKVVAKPAVAPGSDGLKPDTQFTASAIYSIISFGVIQDPNAYYDHIVAQKYNTFMQDPSGIMEFNLGDHQFLQFTEDDGSAASIFDKSEGPDSKKIQYEVQFVDAEETILTDTWHMKQQRLQTQDRLAREERLLLNKNLVRSRQLDYRSCRRA